MGKTTIRGMVMINQQLVATIQLQSNDSYDQYHQQFIEQCNLLMNIPDMPICTMHHIGATAHQTFIGRPIVDILVGLKTLHDVTNLDEKRMNYHHYYRVHRHLIKKVLYAKFSEFHQLNQSYQLHIVEQDSELYHQHLQFHHLMCQHLDYRLEYQKYKQQWVKENNYNIKRYNQCKQQWIQQLLKQANSEKG